MITKPIYFSLLAEEDEEIDNGTVKKETVKTKKKESDTPALDAFGNDLTAAAENGTLDPIVGRDEEIQRVIQILSRRKKNNPILIGEPGVGKSAIVEGLAMRIVRREVSPLLFNKRIYTLDMSAIVAGTKYRGQFEERMQAVMKELRKHPEIILFIDEIHTIIGAGNQAGQLDAANMLKPALARGEMQCIGATTIAEYQKTIEKDGALERRFQKVMVRPTTAEETFDLLKQIAPRYAAHHNVTYTDEVLKACVDLTERYITDRCFPDKAIDAMDEVGARRHIETPSVPARVGQLENQLETLRGEMSVVIQQQDFERALALREQEKNIVSLREQEITKWEKELQSIPETITTDDVARVVALMSGVPVERVATTEYARLQTLGSVLNKRVIGQEEAIKAVVKSIQRNRVGLKDPNRPIGSFLFLGPTGVGKTYLAECLAEEMFGKRDALIRLDMSEFMEKHAVSLLVGAPPGYVGYEEAGKLTEAVRRKPYSIVLFDEIEKAHTDVFNLLLQVMDEGRLTDRQGRHVDFRNTIIILTSNVGTKQLKEMSNGIGFKSAQELAGADKKAILKKALSHTFSPEFLNRIDHILTFDTLTETALEKILDIELGKVLKRFQNIVAELPLQGAGGLLTPAARAHLLKKGYDPQYGARPMKRAVQSEVEDALTDYILAHEGKIDVLHLTLDIQDEKIVVKY